MEKLFLVDAYALIYKCYYAFLGRPMKNAEGINTSPMFGFTKYIRDIIRKEKPHYLGVAFDSKGPTFRHEMYDQYKANRQAAPEDIHASVPYIKQILEAMRIPILEMCGYEADDIIGTLSCEAADAGFEVYMVTPDKDFGQLVGPNVYIYKQLKNGEGVEIIDSAKIKEQYGIDDPKLIADILAIWGDASDNIPGVAGIGEKGAVKLVSEYGAVENILDNLDKISGKQGDKLRASREEMILSKQLATIHRNVPVEFQPEMLKMEDPDQEKLRSVFNKLGFGMFIKELDAGRFVPSTAGATHLKETVRHAVGSARQYEASSGALAGQGDLFASSFTPPAPQSTKDISNTNTIPAPDLFSTPIYEDAATQNGNYVVISDADQLEQITGEIRKSAEFSFNVVTAGQDIFNDKILGISFSYKQNEAVYVPFSEQTFSKYRDIIRPLFEGDSIAKVGHNLKFDIMALKAMLDVETRGLLYDTMILHYLLEPDSRHTLEYLAKTYLTYNPVDLDTITGKGVKRVGLDTISLENIYCYTCEKADIALRLKNVLWDKIKQAHLDRLYLEIEEPMIRVLAQVEMTGVKLDTDSLKIYGRQLASKLDEMESEIRQLTGEPYLNINSSKQLGDVLFRKMAIDPKPKLTKTKQYRTDEEYLLSLSDKSVVIEKILEYRGLKKLLSTYIDALPLLVNKTTGRIHTSFNQAVASTGRLSSSNPNLQNIPIRDEQGREIRKSFVASDNEHLLLSVDYSQVELRLMAHLSQDEGLLEAFRLKEDIHAATAARIFSVPLSEVTSEQRRRAKTANFGIIYGISAYGLGQRLNIPQKEAKEIIEGYFRSYPGVKRYMDNVIAKAKTEGFVETIYGRKRFLPDINSANGTTRGLAERNAINAPIQGSAADIMKMAMVQVYRAFEEKKLRSKIILQVHDELVIDMYAAEQEQVIKIVTESMTQAASLSVELLVDYGIGKNWLEAH